MPYVVRVEQHGKEVKEDRYYTPCQRKKKARKEAGAGTNPGNDKKH